MARGPSQGEAIAVWGVWALIALEVLVTYSWVDPSETYHVSRAGMVGGLSRTVTVVNFPIGLVAIALTLVAVAALPRSVWWAAVPAIAFCATIPFFNDQANLDAHWGNALPAIGVGIALLLTAAAARRAGSAFAPRRPWDAARIVVAALVLLLSLPWLTANLGFHFPGDVFTGEELTYENGTPIAAVHLGHHHGLDGSALVLTALLLSRVAIPRRALRSAFLVYLGTMLAYGSVNFVQDGWNEQLYKRGWTDASIPSAILPSAKPIWLVVLALAVVATLALFREQRSYSAR